VRTPVLMEREDACGAEFKIAALLRSKLVSEQLQEYCMEYVGVVEPETTVPEMRNTWSGVILVGALAMVTRGAVGAAAVAVHSMLVVAVRLESHRQVIMTLSVYTLPLAREFGGRTSCALFSATEAGREHATFAWLLQLHAKLKGYTGSVGVSGR
jgi:hypothetical protein